MSHNDELSNSLASPEHSGPAGLNSGLFMAAMLVVAAVAFWPRWPLDAYAAPKLGLVAVILALAPWPLHRLALRLHLALRLLLTSIALSAICAPDQVGFWFGSPQRGQGGLAALLGLLLCAWSACIGPDQMSKMLAGVRLAVLLVSALTLLQWAGFDPLQTAAPRPAASFGNAVQLGQWLVLVLPLCIWHAWRSNSSAAAWLLVLLGLLALYASGTRGAWLGALLGWSLWYLWPRCKHWWGDNTRVMPAAALALSALVLVVLSLVWVRPHSLMHRMQLWTDAVTVLHAPPAQLWPDGAADSWQAQRIWVGYGADLQVMPLRAIAPASAEFGADPDRAHNLLLDLCLRYGVAGLLLWFLAIRQLMPLLRVPEADSIKHPICAGLLAWLLSLCSGFAGIADSLSAAVLLGVCVSQASRQHDLTGVLPRGWQMLARGALLGGALLVWLVPAQWIPGSWRAPEKALLAFEQARQKLTIARSAEQSAEACAAGALALSHLQIATQLDPTRPEYQSAAIQTEVALCQNCALDGWMCAADATLERLQLNTAPVNGAGE